MISQTKKNTICICVQRLNGSVVDIQVQPGQTISQIKAKLPNGQFNMLTFSGARLNESKKLQDYGIKSGSKIVESPILLDIGVFGQHTATPCRQLLVGNKNSPAPGEIQDLVYSLNADSTSTFSTIHLEVSENILQKLRRFADEKYRIALSINADKSQTEDLKISITKDDLKALTGEELCEKLQSIFGTHYNEIIIRRCEAHGKMINFHTDQSLKTLQFSINGEEQYEGGRLLYVNNGHLEAPKRSKGTVTVHNNRIVHGVTLFQSGIRYGLFFLQK